MLNTKGSDPYSKPNHSIQHRKFSKHMFHQMLLNNLPLKNDREQFVFCHRPFSALSVLRPRYLVCTFPIHFLYRPFSMTSGHVFFPTNPIPISVIQPNLPLCADSELRSMSHLSMIMIEKYRCMTVCYVSL